MKIDWKRILIIMILTIGALLFFFFAIKADWAFSEEKPVSLNTFYQMILSKQLKEVFIHGDEAKAIAINNQVLRTTLPNNYSSFINLLLLNNIQTFITQTGTGSIWPALIANIIQQLLWFFMIFWISGRGMINIGKSDEKLKEDKPKIKFSDVVGMKEKKEMMEIANMLRPERQKIYKKFDCQVPKGMLLFGPPGNGKTLLAKATASEVNAAFFSVSGSDFVEIFVGVGAMRVRDLFKKAREYPISIIFIDEVDALGKRESGQLFADKESNRTINQLLAEMDGFHNKKSTIFVILATNITDNLDPALIRSGRIDLKVEVSNPDLRDREDVLLYYSKKLPIDNVSLIVSEFASVTVGFSRADLANLVNLAKLNAAKKATQQDLLITRKDFEEAFERMILGLPGKRMTKEEIRMVAYHESGHGFIRYFFRGILDPIFKITIVPRGGAGGYVASSPREKSFVSKEEIECNIMSCLAGRLAEEIFLGKNKVSQGCSSDLAHARQLAQRYVTYGMSDEYGLSFIGDEIFARSEKEKTAMSDAIQNLINSLDLKARQILLENREKIDLLVNTLIQVETMTGQEVVNLMEGRVLLPELSSNESCVSLI